MPDAKDNAKMTGDTRPPLDPAPFAPQDLKEANLGADGTPEDRGQAEGGPNDKDNQTRDSNSGTRDSGERPN